MPPYGFDIDDELHDQLRAPVPPGVLAWVERQTKCQVIAQRPLEGGQLSPARVMGPLVCHEHGTGLFRL